MFLEAVCGVCGKVMCAERDGVKTAVSRGFFDLFVIPWLPVAFLRMAGVTKIKTGPPTFSAARLIKQKNLLSRGFAPPSLH